MGRDECAAFHFPFSRDQTIFRMMCLVTGSTGSPGIVGVMEEGLGFCGFIPRAGAFFFSLLFFPFLSHKEDQREQAIPHSVLFLPQLLPKMALWGACVRN